MRSTFRRATTVIGMAASLALVACQAQAPAVPTSAPSAKQQAPASSAPAATSAPAAPQPTSAPAGATQAAPTAAPTTETLKVGIMSALTGSAARTGIANERFVRFGIDDVNAQGGIKVGGKTYKLEGVTADDQYTAEMGRQAANKLVLSDKVRFILGTLAGPVPGAQAFTEPNKVLMFASSATDASLGTNYPYTFVVGSSHVNARDAAIFDWLVKTHPTVKRVGYISTDDANKTAAEHGMKMAEQRGLTVVAKETFPRDIKDFGPLVTRVLRQNPDGLDLITASLGTMATSMMNALYEQGFKGAKFAMSADLAAMCDGGPAWEGYTVTTLVDWKGPVVKGQPKAILDRYVQKYGENDLDTFGLGAYNMASVLKQAIEKAGTVDDTAKIAQVLRDGEWDTMWTPDFGKARLTGKESFGIAQLLSQPIYFSKKEGGKLSTFDMIMATVP